MRRKLKGVRVLVDCAHCEGRGWLPDEALRARGHENAQAVCMMCMGDGTEQVTMGVADFCAAFKVERPR